MKSKTLDATGRGGNGDGRRKSYSEKLYKFTKI